MKGFVKIKGHGKLNFPPSAWCRIWAQLNGSYFALNGRDTALDTGQTLLIHPVAKSIRIISLVFSKENIMINFPSFQANIHQHYGHYAILVQKSVWS